MDTISPERRSWNMSRIRCKDTSIELILRKALWHRGIRYRKNYKLLPGTPDIAITKYRIAIFCDSEFWHGKDWEVLEKRILKGENSEFWLCKIKRNIERDMEVDRELRGAEWTVLRFWGKDIKKNTDECIKVIEEAIFANKLEDISPIIFDEEE